MHAHLLAAVERARRCPAATRARRRRSVKPAAAARRASSAGWPSCCTCSLAGPAVIVTSWSCSTASTSSSDSARLSTNCAASCITSGYVGALACNLTNWCSAAVRSRLPGDESRRSPTAPAPRRSRGRRHTWSAKTWAAAGKPCAWSSARAVSPRSRATSKATASRRVNRCPGAPPVQDVILCQGTSARDLALRHRLYTPGQNRILAPRHRPASPLRLR